MSKTIFDYTAAVGIDASADYLLIEQAVGPIYKKINRNTLMGNTGNPVTDSATQSISAKTFIQGTTAQTTGSSSAIPLTITLNSSASTQNALLVQNGGFAQSGDLVNLKMLNGSDSGRVLTIDNEGSGNSLVIRRGGVNKFVVSNAGAATFTGGTITSPAISGGTIDNATITVDSISGHTTPTQVTVGGVLMNNGVIGTANAVVANSLADSAVTPAKLQTGTGSGWSWQTWAPTLTNITAGNATTEYKYIQIGKTVFFRIRFTLGTTSSIGTGPTISLPVTALASYSAGDMEVAIGLAVSGATEVQIQGELNSTTTIRPVLVGTATTYAGPRGFFTAAVPGAWTTGNFFTLQGTFEAA